MDVTDYLVTLCIRRAELSGLKELPGSTKDQITPLVLLAPWMATTPLERAIDKFEDAFPGRPYFIDVDTYYQPGENANDAKDTWAELAKKPADLDVWHSLLLPYPNANPCLLMAEASFESARAQINWSREHDRSFCLRMNMAPGVGSGIPTWMPNLVTELTNEGAVDYAVVFDFGLVRNALDVAPLATGYILSFFSEIPPEIPLSVCCTTFPSDFTMFDGIEEFGFSNRDLIAQIRQATNRPRIIYGDWGSTKPRAYGHASAPKNRIDYPTDRGWIFARDQDDPVSFQDAAKRITASPQWSGDLGIWGEQLIEGAAAGQAFAIDSMPKMYSARINIHLHRQAFYGHLPPPEALDEEWRDDNFQSPLRRLNTTPCTKGRFRAVSCVHSNNRFGPNSPVYLKYRPPHRKGRSSAQRRPLQYGCDLSYYRYTIEIIMQIATAIPPPTSGKPGGKGLRNRMNHLLPTAAALLLLALPAHADIRPSFVEKTYTISGTTGLALYESIGLNGPRLRGGASSAIAKTDFDLKWGRDYVREGDDCVLAAARSFLTITYTLPKPAGKLPSDIAARWRVFIAGIRAHEAVHGGYIVDMAQDIYDTTVGFRQPNDPNCKTIRNAIQAPLKAAFELYKARNRAFEEAEMSAGGNVQQLILELVNERQIWQRSLGGGPLTPGQRIGSRSPSAPHWS